MEVQKKDFLSKFYKYPGLLAAIIALLTVFFAFQLPRAELDNNNIRFVPENDEARRINRYIDDSFGSSFFILVALERKYGDVFDAGFLNKIREFNNRMEDFEIAGDVTSIVSSDYIFGDGESIIVQKLVANDFSGTPQEISVLKQRLLSWDIYRRSLISDDFRATQILIPLEIDDEMASRSEIIESVDQIRLLAMEMFAPWAEVYVSGLPIISSAINEAMRSDLIIMVPLVILVVLAVLFFSFRNFAFIAMPLISVLISVIWTMGAMPLFGIKLSVVTTVLPVIMVAVGSAYGIHMISHYSAAMKGNSGINRDEHKIVVLSIVGKIKKAMFLAAITTMAGFSSFCFTTVIPVREFGIFASFGVMVSFIMALVLIPSILIIRGPKPGKNSHSSSLVSRSDSGIAGLFSAAVQKKGAVIFAVALIIPVSIWGISKLVIDNIFIEYFKSSTNIYRSDRFMIEKFGGSKVVSVMAEADSTETLLMPEVLVAMDKLGIYLEEQVPEAGKVMGFTDLVKRINQVFNAGESPDGLKPAQVYSNDNAGFGFDSFGFDDFGFDDLGSDDFGFGAFNESDTVNFGGEVTDQLNSGNSFYDNISAAELVSLLREAAFSGKSRSMDAGSLVREMEKLVNYEGAAYYEIPSDPVRYGKSADTELQQLISNYLILLSGNISSYANDSLSPTAIKTTVQLRTRGNIDSARAVDKIRGYIKDNFPGNINIIIGGSALVEASLNELVVESQIISVIFSVILVFLLVSLFNRSFMAGLVGIAPLCICILINFAVMGFAGIKLNIGTSMMASLCVGIGIDYAIHYIEAYKREYKAAGRKGDFILKTFTASGRAIFINAISVAAGFAVLIFSQFIMLMDLGLLIAFTMLTSALVSLTVIPVMLMIIKPKFIYKRLSNE